MHLIAKYIKDTKYGKAMFRVRDSSWSSTHDPGILHQYKDNYYIFVRNTFLSEPLRPYHLYAIQVESGQYFQSTESYISRVSDIKWIGEDKQIKREADRAKCLIQGF